MGHLPWKVDRYDVVQATSHDLEIGFGGEERMAAPLEFEATTASRVSRAEDLLKSLY